MGAEEALEIGLADAVVPDDEVYPTAVAMAAQVRRRPAAGAGRRQAGHRRGPRLRPAGGLELESRLFAGLFDTEDQKTGMASFLAEGPGKADLHRSLTPRRWWGIMPG